jgi:hypothetical protein
MKFMMMNFFFDVKIIKFCIFLINNKKFFLINLALGYLFSIINKIMDYKIYTNSFIEGLTTDIISLNYNNEVLIMDY